MNIADLKTLINQALAFLGKRFDSIEALLKPRDNSVDQIFAEASYELKQLTTMLMVKESDAAALVPAIARSIEMIQGISQTMKKQADAVIAEFDKKGTKESKSVDLLISNGVQLKAIAEILSNVAKSSSEQNEGKHLKNLSDELKTSLTAIAGALQHIEVKAPEVHIHGQEEMAGVLERIEKKLATVSNSEIVSAIKEVVGLLKKKLDFPKTMKFDTDQFRELRTLLSQGSQVSVVGGALGGGVSSASSLKSGRKVIAVTNTAVALGTAACQTAFITALVGNSAPVVVGGSDVIGDEATRTGKLMYPGDSITVSIDNLSKIYINGSANDGVSFTYTR